MAGIKERIWPTVSGLVVIGLALFCLHAFFGEGAVWPSGSRIYEALVFIGPGLLVLGVVATFRALVRAAPFLSSANVFLTGVIMLIVGSCPWVWLPWVMGDARAEEAATLGGFLFVTLGIPGIIIFAVGGALVLLAGW